MDVTRRTVLKAIGAIVMAPCVVLRQEVDIERILLTFCDDDEYRWDLTKPFGVGSLTYATDARHMVRAEIPNRFEDGERRLSKGVEDVWKCNWHPAEFRPFELPKFDKLVTSGNNEGGICPQCSGRRISFGASMPDAEQYMSLVKYSYDPDDNTYNDPSCGLCHGRTYYGPWCVEVCGVLMSYARLKLLTAIPNVMVSVNRATYEEAPLLFRGEGIEGMTMGLSPCEAN